MIHFHFTEAFCKRNEDYFNLLFISRDTNSCILFDGLNFYQKTLSDGPLREWIEFNYPPNQLVDIRQNEGIFYLKMGNGDIFQLFFTMDGISPQSLSIWSEEHKSISTPTDLSSYEATSKSFEEAEKYELIQSIVN